MRSKHLLIPAMILVLTSCAATNPTLPSESAPSTSPSEAASSSPAPTPTQPTADAEEEFDITLYLNETDTKIYQEFLESYPVVKPDVPYDMISTVRLKGAIEAICESYASGLEEKFMVAMGVNQVVETLPNFSSSLDVNDVSYHLIDLTVKYACPEYTDLLEVGEL